MNRNRELVDQKSERASEIEGEKTRTVEMTCTRLSPLSVYIEVVPTTSISMELKGVLTALRLVSTRRKGKEEPTSRVSLSYVTLSLGGNFI